jgi:hypothetical protein
MPDLNRPWIYCLSATVNITAWVLLHVPWWLTALVSTCVPILITVHSTYRKHTPAVGSRMPSRCREE